MTNKTSTGYRSSGYYSTGYYSTGDYSTGNRSTGDYSTGDYSTGYCSTGNRSTGNCSTGNRSTGDWSTGNWSTGNRSTGNRSTGNWSTSNYSTGHFSTEDYSGFGAFNKPCTQEEWENAEKPDFIYFELTEWITKDNMSDKEKHDNPSCDTTDGYLKAYTYREAWAKAWAEASDKDKELLYALPNFDAEVFKEISGIDVNTPIKEVTINELQDLLGYKIKIVESKKNNND